jgi:hypothetical protein
MRNVFPFTTGSAVTASYASEAGVSLQTLQTISASFATTAQTIINSTGPRGKYICSVTYDEYQMILAGTHVENCISEEFPIIITTTTTTEPLAADFLVTNSGAGAYIINDESNPNITLTRGQIYTFDINSPGHPFWIQSVPAPYSSDDVYNVGITNNGTDFGTIIWNVDLLAPSTLYYVCQFHSVMTGTITII